MVDGIQEFIESMQNDYVEPSKTYRAEISSVDSEGNVWVYLEGSNQETPTASSSSEVRSGDTVNVEFRNNKLYIVGNVSNPSAGVTRVANAEGVANTAIQDASRANAAAEIANQSAAEAKAYARDAQEHADDAERSANNAQTYADNALSEALEAKQSAERANEDAKAANDSLTDLRNNLSTVVQGATTVEKAVSVMQTAIESVLDYDPETDTTQQWFWHDDNGAHILSDVEGYRNDLSSSGMSIVDISTEKSVAEFGAPTARVGLEGENNISITNTRMSLYSDGTEVAYLDGQRFKSSDIVATNLYMQTIDASTGDVIGQIGWVMRSSGHLSLKLIR